MLETVKWLGGLLTAIAVILSAIVTIRGEWPQVLGQVIHDPKTPGIMSPLLDNVNLLGNDISKGEASANAEECQTRCSFDNGCRAMTYEIITSSGGRCWLKNAVPPESPNGRSISSIKNN